MIKPNIATLVFMVAVAIAITCDNLAFSQSPKRADSVPLNVLVLYADLAPTILAAVGLEAPKTMQGRDMSSLYLADEAVAWREEFFYEHPMIKRTDFIPASEALVRKGWKYFYWPEFEREQLFDINADPMEENDLVANPAHAQQLAEMRTKFAELKAAAR